MAYRIVPMSEQTRLGKGMVHYTAWQETYSGLMPEEILSSLSVEQCAVWAKQWADSTLVALCQEQVIGFACYCQQARDFTGRKNTSEIMALYVLSDHQHKGVGRALMEQCLRRLPHPAVVLYVLKGNKNAMEFYRHMGFELTGKELIQPTDYGDLKELEMLLIRP